MVSKDIMTVIAIIALVIVGIGIISALTQTRATIEWVEKPYKVASGDTLWGLARRYCPETADIRQWIYDVEQINRIDSGKIYAGTTITILTTKELEK